MDAQDAQDFSGNGQLVILSIRQSAHDHCRTRLLVQSRTIRLPVVALGTVAMRGLVDRDINGGPTDRSGCGPARGPFTVRSIHPSEVPTYPMLWSHTADRERRFVVLPDSCGDPRLGDEVWAAER